MKPSLFYLLVFVFLNGILVAQQNTNYQTPPEPLLSLVDITPAPIVSIAPNNDKLLLIYRGLYKSIEELAQKEYRLAGVRINPENFTQSRQTFYDKIEIYDRATEKTVALEGLPKGARLYGFSFSPEGNKVAVLNATANSVELWVADLQTAQATKINTPPINDAMPGSPFSWLRDGSGFLVKTRSSSNQNEPKEALAPAGPAIQESDGKKSTVRTYQDLLRNPYQEELFEYFATADLIEVKLDGSSRILIKNKMLRSHNKSPNGKYLLMECIEKPFSYLVPWYLFPTVTQVAPLNDLSQTIALYNKPLGVNIPQGFDAVQPGKRNFNWRHDKESELFWVEALDEGDPKKEVPYRDQGYVLEAPFTGKAKAWFRVKYRFAGFQEGDSKWALVYDRWWKTRKSTVYQIHPNKENKTPKVLFELNTEDRYADPGDFLTERDEKGYYVLKFSKNKKALFLTGEGYGPEGNRPFLDKYDIASGRTERLWQAAADSHYERIVKVLDPENMQLITRRESNTQHPDYYLRTSNALKQITQLPNPYKSFEGVSKQRIEYKRADGVALNATLYLPENYNKEKEGALPALLWAYPREFKSTKTAGQITQSPYTYTYLYYGSPVYWAAMGYAIIDNAAFPIIGQGDEEPNDSFVAQLTANAEAVLHYTAKDLGVVDAKRVAVGGHSYGAFMTANLLAHTDLFAAGIARSGAYNRTLTPFGFQGEERTYWQAPDIYNTMSPFMNAHKIKSPILLIHGEADNNSGTFPIQSERLYEAIKGLGGKARLVMLPHESHGYQARESILHMMWEQNEWLEKWLKR